MTETYVLKVKQDERGWHVTVPAMPGIIASGQTEREMQDNLVDTIMASGYLDTGNADQ